MKYLVNLNSGRTRFEPNIYDFNNIEIINGFINIKENNCEYIKIYLEFDSNITNCTEIVNEEVNSLNKTQPNYLLAIIPLIQFKFVEIPKNKMEIPTPSSFYFVIKNEKDEILNNFNLACFFNLY